MRTPLNNILPLLLLLCFPFALVTGQDMDRADLEGSWTLIKYKYGSEAQYSEVPRIVTYVKHLTRNHFSWASYGEKGELLTAGGGRYTFKDGKYREEIDYFHPIGSNLPGTYADFDYSITGNNWQITGYVNNVQLDPGSGEFEQVDSIKLDEVWQRL